MSRFKRQLEEDRALRDAARTLFHNDLAYVREEMTPTALGERLADNVGQKVDAASDEAVDLAQRHGGKIATAGGALAAGIGLWLARKPILDWLAPLFSNGEAGVPNKSGDESFADEDWHDE
jgi:hypothetical protein